MLSLDTSVVLTLDVQLEGPVESERDSGVDDARVVSDLDLGIEEFSGKIFQLALTPLGSRLLKEREAGHIAILALVLLFVELKVMKVLHKRVADDDLIVQDLFQLKFG